MLLTVSLVFEWNRVINALCESVTSWRINNIPRKNLSLLIIEVICDTCIDLCPKSIAVIFCGFSLKINTNSFLRSSNQMRNFCMLWLAFCFLVNVICTGLEKIKKWVACVTDSFVSLLQDIDYFNFFLFFSLFKDSGSIHTWLELRFEDFVKQNKV